MKMDDMDKKLLSIKDAMKYLGVGRIRLIKLIKSGNLKHIKIDSGPKAKIYFTKELLDDLFNSINKQ